MNWDWQFTFEVVLPKLLPVVPVTIQATVFSFLLALVLGLFLMLLRISRYRLIAAPAGELIEFIRGTPLLVQLFFLFFLLPQVGITLPPLTTGILGIGIYNAALCAEVYRAGIQAVPAGQWEAAKALNLGPYRIWRDIIIPQSLPPVVPALGNYLIGIFKETPLLSFLAVGELMHASKLIGSEYYRFTEAVTLAGVFFLVMRLIAAPAGELIEFIRGTPLLVQLFFLFFLLPQVGITLPPLTTGILGIGIYNAALCAEVYRAGIQAVPAGQWEAAKALNLGPYRIWRDIIIPQSLPPVVPALGNYLIGIFKETPLLSFLAVGELMHASKLIGSEYYRFTEAVTLAGVFFLVMSLIAAVLVRMVETRVRRSILR